MILCHPQMISLCTPYCTPGVPCHQAASPPKCSGVEPSGWVSQLEAGAEALLGQPWGPDRVSPILSHHFMFSPTLVPLSSSGFEEMGH